MVVALLGLATCGEAVAVSGSWTATTSGTWSIAGNWSGGTIATGSGFTATFANNITSNVDVNLDSTRNLSAVVFGDANTSSAASWTISGTTLTLQAPLTSGTGAATITVNSLGTGATATISGSLTVTNNGGVFIKDGVGTLILGGGVAGANTIGGKTSIIGGTLQISANSQLGGNPGSFTVDQLTISNGAALRTSAAVTLGQNRGVTIGSGGGTLNLNGGALTYAGRFTGVGQTLTTAGASGLTLSNATGVASNVNFDVTGGSTRLFFTNSDALGTGTATLRNTTRLTYTGASPLSAVSRINLDSGSGITARSDSLTLSNVVFPSSGSILLNTDDTAQNPFALAITSGGTLTGILTIDTKQTGITQTVGNVTLSGVFSGAGGLEKSGTGTSGIVILGAANTYTGNTTISTGTLKLGAAGSIANSGTISVASVATFDTSLVPSGYSLAAAQWLMGSGTVLGNVSSLGTIAPGVSGSAGTLSFANDLSLDSGSLLSYGLSGTTTTVGGGINDLSAVTGNLTLDGTLNVSEIGVGSFLSATQGNSWRLFTYSGTLTNNGLVLGSTPTLSSGLTLAVDTSTSNEVNLIVVPEPTATVSAMVGISALAMLRARLTRKKNRDIVDGCRLNEQR
jgi:fibronectin-binding autotransporter adhesin